MNILIALFLLIPTLALADYFKTDANTMIETGSGAKEGYIVGEYTESQINKAIEQSNTDYQVYAGKAQEKLNDMEVWVNRQEAWKEVFNQEIVNADQ